MRWVAVGVALTVVMVGLAIWVNIAARTDSSVVGSRPAVESPGTEPKSTGGLTPWEQTSAARDTTDDPLRSDPVNSPAMEQPSRSAGNGAKAAAALKARFNEVDAALGELVKGHLAFNTPERMEFRESRTIALIASPELDAPALSEALRNRIRRDDPIEVAQVQIAPIMEAQLEGAPAFEVVPLTPVRQPVSSSTPTEWRWRVIAQEPGTRTLHLTMNAVINVGEERFPRVIDVFDREILVEITTGQRVGMFLHEEWEFVVGTILIPLGVWLWTNRRKGPKKKRKGG